MGDTLEPLHAGLTRTAPTPASQAEDAARTSVPADRPVLGPVPPKEIVPPVSTQQDIKTSTQMFISDARIIIKKLNECIARGDKAGAFAIVNDEVEIVKGKKNSAILFQAGYKTLDSIKESITSGRPVSLRMNLIDNAVTIVQEGKYYLEGAGVDLVAASRYLEQYNENKEQTTTAFILGGSSYSHKQEAQAEARKSFRDMWTDKKDGSLSQPAARDLFKYFIDVSTLFDSDTIDLFFNLPLDENAAIGAIENERIFANR